MVLVDCGAALAGAVLISCGGRGTVGEVFCCCCEYKEGGQNYDGCINCDGLIVTETICESRTISMM